MSKKKNFKGGVPRKNISGAPVSDMYKEEQMQNELISAYESNPKKYAYLKDYIGHDFETRSTSKIFQENRKKKILDHQKKSLTLKRGGKTKHFRGNRQFD
jgi:hypothetical protein